MEGGHLQGENTEGLLVVPLERLGMQPEKDEVVHGKSLATSKWY